MKTKYYKYTLKGEYSADEAQRAIGDAGPQGLVVRIDSARGETNLYIASQGGAGSSGTKKAASTKGKKAAAPSGVKFVEVSEKEVTKI